MRLQSCMIEWMTAPLLSDVSFVCLPKQGFLLWLNLKVEYIYIKKYTITWYVYYLFLLVCWIEISSFLLVLKENML